MCEGFYQHKENNVESHARVCVRSRIMCSTSQKFREVLFFFYSALDTLEGNEGAGSQRPSLRRLIVFKRFRLDPDPVDIPETLIARPSLKDRRFRQKNKYTNEI